MITWLLLLLTTGIGPAGPLPSQDWQKARELKAALVVLRDAIDAYAADHDGFFPSPSIVQQLTSKTDADGTISAASPFGPYLPPEFVTNPIDGKAIVTAASFMPTGPSALGGWWYVVHTGEIRANVPGVGPNGVPWFEY